MYDACHQRPFFWCEKFELLSFPQKSISIDLVPLLLLSGDLLSNNHWYSTHLLWILICILKLQFAGAEIATDTVAFATEIFPSATKISGELANLQFVLIFALSKQKDYHFSATFAKINKEKEITELFCFLPWISFQSEDSLIVA